MTAVYELSYWAMPTIWQGRGCISINPSNLYSTCQEMFIASPPQVKNCSKVERTGIYLFISGGIMSKL